MSLGSSRVLQYVVIVVVLVALGGGYWYWKQAQAAQTVTDNRPSFEAPLMTDLNLTAGQGIATYSRADGADRRATVTDFEGRIISVKASEARFTGARRVENLLLKSDTYDATSWPTRSVLSFTTGITDPLGGTTAIRVASTGANGYMDSAAIATTEARTYRFSVWVKNPGVDTSSTLRLVLLADGNTISASNYVTNSVSSTWTRYSIIGTTPSATTTIAVRSWGGSYYAAGETLDLAFPMFEEVTGQTNQNPSEYVSMNVKPSFPYHGAGVDGVKYFSTQNGNTVASNVVTDATGSTIPPSTLKGYLAEGGRTNLALRSESFDNASWGKTDSMVTADNIVSPSGKNDAELITEGVAGDASVNQGITVSASTSYTFSIFLKRGNHDWARVVAYQQSATSNQFRIWANLATGTLGTGSAGGTGTYTSSAIQDFGNGWYRVSIIGTLPGTDGVFATVSASDNGSTARVNNGTRYAWGAQVELGLFASSYIPTTSVSVPRVRDNLKYVGASNFNNTAGTTTADVTTGWTGGNGLSAFFTDDSSGYQRMAIWHWGGSVNHVGVDRNGGGGTRNNYDGTITITAGTTMRLGQRWTSSSNALFSNGALAGSRTTALTLPYDSISGISIGQRGDSNSDGFASIKNVRSWKKALSDTELINLTSLTQAVSDSAVRKVTVKTPNSTGLVGYWSFDEGSGTSAEDFSPAGANTGTLTNGPAWVDGKFGKAVNFDGTNDYVRVSSLDNANFPTIGAISFWIKGDFSTQESKAIFDDYNDARNHVFIRTNTSVSGIQVAFQKNDGTYKFHNVFAVPSNQWNHVVVVWNTASASGSIYLNGSNVYTASITDAAWAPNQQRGYFGGGLATYFSGSLDEVRLYNRALPASEITGLYQTGSATKVNVSQNTKLTNGLVGIWSFNGQDVSGSTAYDRSGNNNTGALVGGYSVFPGKVGQGMKFNGTNSYASIPVSATLDANFFRNSNWTISFWAKPTLTGDALQELFMGLWHKPRLLLASPGGSVTFAGFVSTIYTGFISGASFFSADTWAHLTLVSNGTNYLLYKNGTQVASVAYAQIDATASSFRIGADGSGNGRFNGIMDEFRVYNRALSASEVQELYNLGK